MMIRKIFTAIVLASNISNIFGGMKFLETPEDVVEKYTEILWNAYAFQEKCYTKGYDIDDLDVENPKKDFDKFIPSNDIKYIYSFFLNPSVKDKLIENFDKINEKILECIVFTEISSCFLNKNFTLLCQMSFYDSQKKYQTIKDANDFFCFCGLFIYSCEGRKILLNDYLQVCLKILDSNCIIC